MANLFAYDPTRGGTVPIDQARVIAYVIDQDTGKRYSTRAEAEAATKASDASYYARDPKTGLSPAQVEANKAVEEAAAAAGMKVTPGATGPKATAARVSTTPITKTPTSTGKKIVGYTKWTNPFNGVTYNIPKYEDGTDASSEWTGGAQVPASFMLVSERGGYSGGGTDTGAAEKLKAEQAAKLAAEEKRRQGQSAYDLLFSEFDRYGLGALVEPLKGFVVEGLSPAEFTLRLRETDAYKKRFAANQQRIAKGLRALSEAEYIGLEDQYQNVMRQYGLPESYYQRGEMGTQQGFEKFIGGDVSAAELEDRIQTAQNRVINAAPEVSKALREFYPDITNGDILAYALDPQQAITNIKRKVTAAEIGAGALQAGLATGVSRAEELQKYGVTGEAARQGFQAIAGYLPRASTLADIYGKQGMGPFTQGTAEAEVFGTPGAAEAATKRRKLSELEQASFSGQAGRAQGALARERAGQF